MTKLTLMPLDEQKFPTTETYRISTDISTLQLSVSTCKEFLFVLFDLCQNSKVSLEFSPSARTVHPIDSTFSVEYNVKVAGKVPMDILRDHYSIKVSSLRTQSSVSIYNSCIRIQQICLTHNS